MLWALDTQNFINMEQVNPLHTLERERGRGRRKGKEKGRERVTEGGEGTQKGKGTLAAIRSL